MRSDGRANDVLRPVSIERNYTKYAEGSVLVAFGDTKVICTASLDRQVPPFLRDSGTGWVTAEYAMLPRSTHERNVRDSMKKGRALEISRLIGRTLRSVVDMAALGERQVIVDCDVLQADGGTRTAAITGSYVALCDALDNLVRKGIIDASPISGQCAAVSLGLLKDEILLDLCYEEDSRADVDMNLVMRADGALIELQCTAEKKAFPRATLNAILDLGERGIRQLLEIQNEARNRV
jgi:ribonuclease PH